MNDSVLSAPLAWVPAAPTCINDLPADLLAQCLLHACGQKAAPVLALGRLNKHFHKTAIEVLSTAKVLDLTPGPLTQLECRFNLHAEGALLGYVKIVVGYTKVLQEINLSGSYTFVTDDSLAQILDACPPTLVRLKVDHCDKLTEYGMHAISKRAPLLQELSLQRVSNGVTCWSFLGLEKLTVLDISWNRDIASDAIEQLAPRLKRLTMRGCETIKNDVLKHTGNMEFIDIVCTLIGDVGLSFLIEGAPRLRHIVIGTATHNIWPPVHWSPEGLAAFRARRPDVLISMAVC